MTIQYYTKHVYGKPLMYLANTRIEDQDKPEYQTHSALKGLLQKQTIDNRDIKILEMLGFNFEHIINPEL